MPTRSRATWSSRWAHAARALAVPPSMEEIEPAGEAHGAEHAQGVLLKATVGLTHRADLATSQVTAAVVAVEQTANRMPGHRVHREVAPREVILDARGALHALGVTAVGVKPVQAIGRDLDALAVHHGRDAAELDAGLHDRDAAARRAAALSSHDPLQQMSIS